VCWGRGDVSHRRRWEKEERLRGFAGPGTDQGWAKDDAFRGGDFKTESLLKSGEVEFGGGGEIEFLHCRQEALHKIGGESVTHEVLAAPNERIQTHSWSRESGVEINLVKFEADLNVRADGEKRLPNQGNGVIESGRGRQGTTVRHIEFLEHSEAAGAEVMLEFAEGGNGIGIVDEDVTANDGVKWFIERHFDGVAFEEANVTHAAELGARDGPLAGGGDAHSANDFTPGANEIGEQESDITAAAANIENTHAGGKAGLPEKLAGEGFIRSRLTVEAMEFLLGIAKSVRGALCGSRVHDSLRKRSWSGLAGNNNCSRKRGGEVKRKAGRHAQVR
jgi:hypothetical protein